MAVAKEARVDEIDGLRGIAILSVVLYHLLVLPSVEMLSEAGTKILSLSAYGVDLFFVISGFLIGNIFLKMEGRSGLAAFYIRRIFRIWPLYYLLLFLVYSIVSDKSKFSGIPYWSFPLFIFNYWESFGRKINPALLVLWSIAIEEQFYLIGPLAFSLFKKRQMTILLAICVLFSPFLRLALSYGTDIVLWRFTPARIDGICMGLLISIFLSHNGSIKFLAERIKYLKGLTIVLLLSLIPCVALASDHLWESFGHSLIVFAFASVLLLVQAHKSLGNRMPVLSGSFLRYLGLRCYSIYLFHGFFHMFAVFFSKNIYVDALIVSILTLAFAHFSWIYIETPLIRLGRRFSYAPASR